MEQNLYAKINLVSDPNILLNMQLYLWLIIVQNSLDYSDIVIGVFLYLKKDFDTVYHTILLKKLYAYGIRSNALKWLTSYLTGRT